VVVFAFQAAVLLPPVTFRLASLAPLSGHPDLLLIVWGDASKRRAASGLIGDGVSI
jgi:hypothetical protein